MFAIRHKPTGNFLPSWPTGVRNAGTHYEPCPHSERSPRIFMKPHHAQAALRMWLKGRLVVHSHGNLYDDSKWEWQTVPDRKSEEMEIVPISLIVKESPSDL